MALENCCIMLLRASMRFFTRLVSMPEVKGLVRYESAPAWYPLLRSSIESLAVSSTTGMWLVRTSFLIMVHSVNPSITGIMMSEITRSGIYLVTRL